MCVQMLFNLYVVLYVISHNFRDLYWIFASQQLIAHKQGLIYLGLISFCIFSNSSANDLIAVFRECSFYIDILLFMFFKQIHKTFVVTKQDS